MRKAFLVLWALCLLCVTACSDDKGGEEYIPDPPERGIRCVTVLDQFDEPMPDCHFSFSVDERIVEEDETYLEDYPEVEDWKPELSCPEGNLLVYGEPKAYQIAATCGDLSGRISVDLDEGVNDPLESRLIGSFCWDETDFVLTPSYPSVNLMDHLGFSDNLRCKDYFEREEIDATLVVELFLDCEGSETCDPTNGRNYLEADGPQGYIDESIPLHLNFNGLFENMAEEEEVVVWVRLRQESGSMQELNVPIHVRNNP